MDRPRTTSSKRQRYYDNYVLLVLFRFALASVTVYQTFIYFNNHAKLWGVSNFSQTSRSNIVLGLADLKEVVCLQNDSWFHRIGYVFLDSEYAPANCKIPTYTSRDINQCFENQTLHTGGDDTMKQIFRAFTAKLAHNKTGNVNKAGVTKVDEEQSRTVATFLQDSTGDLLAAEASASSATALADIEWPHRNPIQRPSKINGWLYLAYRSTGYDEVSALSEQRNVSRVLNELARCSTTSEEILDNSRTVLDALDTTPIVIISGNATRLSQGLSTSPGSAHDVTAGTWHALQVLSKEERVLLIVNDLSFTETRLQYLSKYRSSYIPPQFVAMSDMLVYSLCNQSSSAVGGVAPMCCQHVQPLYFWYWLSITASFIVTAAIGCIDIVLLHLGKPFSFVLNAIGILIATVQYCWLTDRTFLFAKTSRSSDVRLFVLLLAALCLCTCRSWTRKPEIHQEDAVHARFGRIMSRELTEEWKGWMQAVLLLYHYFGLSKTLWVYQLARVLVAGYLFLTGYGHTTYFLRTNDFSLNRVTKTLLRLNLLSCVLAYTMDKPWDFYYFPGLSSFWFVVMFVTLRCARATPRRPTPSRALTCLIVSFLVVQVSLYTQHGNMAWSLVLQAVRSAGGPNMDTRECIFRVKLDSAIPYVGAMLAIINAKFGRDRAETFADSTTARHDSNVSIARAAIVSMTLFLLYCLVSHSFTDKVASNVWHPVTSFIPVIFYLALRNASACLRNHYHRASSWLGSISLETYVLQSHIWLANDSKGLLGLSMPRQFASLSHPVLANGAKVLDKLAITALFLLTSHMANYATVVLTDWLVSGTRTRVLILLFISWLLNFCWISV